MMLVERAAVVSDDSAGELLAQARTTLVHVPRGVHAELFGGWGVRI